jgi:dienelactone hydrolase
VAKNRKIGTQGYCMGGPIAFRTAAAVPAEKAWSRLLALYGKALA